MQSSPHNITLFKPNLGRLVSPLAVTVIRQPLLLPVSKHGWHKLYRFTSWQARPLFSGSLGWRCNLTTSAAVVCLSCFFRWRCRWRLAVGVRCAVTGGVSFDVAALHPYITAPPYFSRLSGKNFLVRSAVPGGVAAPGWAWVARCSALRLPGAVAPYTSI